MVTMVVNLCLPHFCTTAHCNKVCADGYDVTNLVSADPAVRRRGFKLEYFLRPPVQVTLQFGFQVELCRVDVELWPWGMDRGQACKRLEISTSSDPLLPSSDHKPVLTSDHVKTGAKHPNTHNSEKHRNRDSKSHPWSVQAQQWGEEAASDSQLRAHVFKSQSNPESNGSTPEFKLVARCELREETQVCFTRSNFRPRAPFLSPPPPRHAHSRHEELWSRGVLSLDAVTQLRVTVPFGGAASSLGLKALTVWGQPARRCSAEQVEWVKRVHQASEPRLRQPAFFTSSVKETSQPPQAPSNLSIPDEFLDPITQEVMALPLLLPCGVSVDNATLEEYQKREATWGRPPNDPFTGVPFTSSSQPLPNPQLKSRIDHFLLQSGMMKKEGMLGRQDQGENPQASRLVESKPHGPPQISSCLAECSENRTAVPHLADVDNYNRTVQTENYRSGLSIDTDNDLSNIQTLNKSRKSEVNKGKKRVLTETSTESTEMLIAGDQQTKKTRADSVSAPSYSSHEQRLSSSLDEALSSALQGRPSFTSNLLQRKPVDSESQTTTPQNPSSSLSSPSAGEKTCASCSRSVSVYSTTALSVYRLTCGHLLCRSCLQMKSKQGNSLSVATSNHILCPTCQRSTPHSAIIRVHH
ncbi:RING finger protein 37 isoform X2 [Salarias fasciatus]|uniref:U-box domain containing 5 n=1 Tax=Salarias fasciatus TaxID=181472 RepID=A0A672JGG5_SALFA|nr:RING finger protein 37 isoform X2 [Salarias fasciatus]